MQAHPFKVLWKCKPSHLWFFGIIDEYDFVYTTFYHKSTDKHVPLGMFEDVSGPLNIFKTLIHCVYAITCYP